MPYYDLDQVSLTVAGIIITGGYGEGGSINITRNTERFENVVGRTGEVVRSKTNDNTAVAEVVLLQTSADNAKLAALARLDANAPNGAGVGAFQCQDRVNGDLHVSDKCWVQQDPDHAFNRQQTDRTWMIYLEKLESFPGGRP